MGRRPRPNQSAARKTKAAGAAIQGQEGADCLGAGIGRGFQPGQALAQPASQRRKGCDWTSDAAGRLTGEFGKADLWPVAK